MVGSGRFELHSAFHRIQTLIFSRLLMQKIGLHSAFHRIQTWIGCLGDSIFSMVALRFSSHSNWIVCCGAVLCSVVALRFSSHSNNSTINVGRALFQVALRFSSHSNYSTSCFTIRYLPGCTPLFIAFKPDLYYNIVNIESGCTPLFIAFKQGGLLRSFSKRGEHMASERGMHLEC